MTCTAMITLKDIRVGRGGRGGGVEGMRESREGEGGGKEDGGGRDSGGVEWICYVRWGMNHSRA